MKVKVLGLATEVRSALEQKNKTRLKLNDIENCKIFIKKNLWKPDHLYSSYRVLNIS